MRNCKSFIFLAAMILVFIGTAAVGAAEYGLDCLNGIDMAVKEINDHGGIAARGMNYTLRVEKADDRLMSSN